MLWPCSIDPRSPDATVGERVLDPASARSRWSVRQTLERPATGRRQQQADLDEKDLLWPQNRTSANAAGKTHAVCCSERADHVNQLGRCSLWQTGNRAPNGLSWPCWRRSGRRATAEPGGGQALRTTTPARRRDNTTAQGAPPKQYGATEQARIWRVPAPARPESRMVTDLVASHLAASPGHQPPMGAARRAPSPFCGRGTVAEHPPTEHPLGARHGTAQRKRRDVTVRR